MTDERNKTALIIGAGPAGLTAALELLRRSRIRPIVLEASDAVGGISRTINFNGYRMDLGGHRFFSKSDWVMDWWQQILPLDPSAMAPGETARIAYRNRSRDLARAGDGAAAADDPGRIMLLRNRLSRIYFLHKFFDYPIKLNLRTVRNLGALRCCSAALSYAWASVFPRRPERSLEDFLVNRFGGALYRTFFKSYTEKVWGVPCTEISAEWGAQRIKGLSLTRAVLHALRQTVAADPAVRQDTETSLVEHFLYPRLGPGQLWEAVAEKVRGRGGEIRLRHTVERIEVADGRVAAVGVRDATSGASVSLAADYVISTMAVKDLFASFDPPASEEAARIAQALPYRDFVTVGVIAKKMKRPSSQRCGGDSRMLPDNWIYIQEPDVKLGRLQIFNNWSPALVPESGDVWLGLEYFCNSGDALWQSTDAEIQALAVRELEQIDLIAAADVVAATVVRVPKAYPAYFGAYAQFGVLREHTDRLGNLFLVGRNGMHRYNNQDHSMLTAKAAVDNIVTGRSDKANLWDINVDDDYHEAK